MGSYEKLHFTYVQCGKPSLHNFKVYTEFSYIVDQELTHKPFCTHPPGMNGLVTVMNSVVLYDTPPVIHKISLFITTLALKCLLKKIE